MVIKRAQKEAAQSEKEYVFPTLGFNEADAEVLDYNHVSDITYQINTVRRTYHIHDSAHRGSFTITDVEQIEVFKEWTRKNRNSH